MKKDVELAIYGAAIGDAWGSAWEFRKEKPKSLGEALLLDPKATWTDDTVMTAALAKAISQLGGEEFDGLPESASEEMRMFGAEYPASYGGRFQLWLWSKDPKPYHSYGNGAPMRASPAGLAATSLAEAARYADAVTRVTHDHPDAMECARAVASLVFLAKEGKTKKKMAECLEKHHGGIFKKISSMDLESLHEAYAFDETAMGTAPQAIWCFLSSSSFDDCLARSLYVGGDSDTLAAIACSIAAPYYGDGQVGKHVIYLIANILPDGIYDAFRMFSERFLRYNPRRYEKAEPFQRQQRSELRPEHGEIHLRFERRSP